ncbi:unnamed protein product [Cyprideis torosa]|uniref:PPM-type phosphatase domain-containing protein n=1 Tax=Cyprideis torosa TaxID=163714 RepID=A0A7R8ZLM5_9CRUS|nr:unnamed protein product [Cyprideis torosa]CAG0887016.1 unnamed protein product [Cyprideis torosa]
MGGFLDKPKTEKHNEDGVGPSGLSYGLSSMQGWRMEMEDAHCAVTGLSPRALGDFVYKQVEGKGPTEQLVSPEPEITVQERQLTDEFLVLACDGIWDVMSNDDVCEFIRSRLKVTESLSQVANEVVDTCLYKGSQDNMSIVLVKFEGAPKLDEAAVEADKQLDKWIESNIENLFKEHTERPEIETIREALNSREDKPAFPPGGGIHAKHHIMERTLDKLFPPEESKK